MNILIIHSSYKGNNWWGQWFSATKQAIAPKGGHAYFAIKFKHTPGEEGDIMVGSSVSCGIHARLCDWLGLQDMWSYFATRRFLKLVDKITPPIDIIHLHVVNDVFLNMGLLCRYANRKGISVVWTFHDARVLTARCPYPGYIDCELWKTKCCGKQCRWRARNGLLHLEGITHLYRKLTIGRLKRLTIATPSQWMADLVGQSYLKDKPRRVIHNGIDLKTFRPVAQNVRERYGIAADKTLLLSVANPIWDLKGRQYLLRLLDDLPENYFFLWVGCMESDVERLRDRKNLIALPRVDHDELVAFYSAADLFVNPTLAECFGLTNVECQACGTPVVAFATDGTPETLSPEASVTVPRKDYEALRDAILHFRFEGARERSIEWAQQFSREKMVENYVKLYEEVSGEAKSNKNKR